MEAGSLVYLPSAGTGDVQRNIWMETFLKTVWGMRVQNPISLVMMRCIEHTMYLSVVEKV